MDVHVGRRGMGVMEKEMDGRTDSDPSDFNFISI